MYIVVSNIENGREMEVFEHGENWDKTQWVYEKKFDCFREAMDYIEEHGSFAFELELFGLA